MDNGISNAGCARITAFVFVAGLGALVAATPAQASFHTFQIDEVYSDAMGNVQFIELHEAFNSDFEDLLAGHAMTSQQGPATRVYTFPNNLPSSATANKHVLIGTAAFASLGVVTPDYIVPAPFLFPGGGSLDYAGVDSISYPAFPTDSTKSLDRSGNPGTNSPTNFAGETGSIRPPNPGITGPPGQGIPALNLAGFVLLALGVLVVGLVISRRRT